MSDHLFLEIEKVARKRWLEYLKRPEEGKSENDHLKINYSYWIAVVAYNTGKHTE